jgi:hypothetical protein
VIVTDASRCYPRDVVTVERRRQLRAVCRNLLKSVPAVCIVRPLGVGGGALGDQFTRFNSDQGHVYFECAGPAAGSSVWRNYAA